MSEITTEDCREAIIDWLVDKAPSRDWASAGLSAYLVQKNWKRRTKTVTGGSTFRSFTAGSVNAAGQVASLEVVESIDGHLTVRVDAANQPGNFLRMIAIKTVPGLSTNPEEPVDRGQEFGSW